MKNPVNRHGGTKAPAYCLVVGLRHLRLCLKQRGFVLAQLLLITSETQAAFVSLVISFTAVFADPHTPTRAYEPIQPRSELTKTAEYLSLTS